MRPAGNDLEDRAKAYGLTPADRKGQVRAGDGIRSKLGKYYKVFSQTKVNSNSFTKKGTPRKTWRN